MRAVARELATLLKRQVVVTIAAGIRLADLSRWLLGYRRLVRAMPNTPALIGAGIAGLYALSGVDGEGRTRAASILEAVGATLWCEREDELDAVTAVSGSGPAYVFYFLEALEQSARELGFAPADARRLAYATFSGSMRLAEQSESEPCALACPGDVQRRHDRARDRRDGRGEREGRDHRGGQGRGRARPRAGRALRIRALNPDHACRRAPLSDQYVFALIVYSALLRFIMQWLRAPFRNPLGQAVAALTDWAVKPLRKILPGFRGLDWASLIFAWLAQLLWLLSLAMLAGAVVSGPLAGALAALAVIELLKAALWILIVAVFLQAILSWVAPDGPLAGVLECAHVSLPGADSTRDPAARRRARSFAADRHRACAAAADAAGGVARAGDRRSSSLAGLEIVRGDEAQMVRVARRPPATPRSG